MIYQSRHTFYYTFSHCLGLDTWQVPSFQWLIVISKVFFIFTHFPSHTDKLLDILPQNELFHLLKLSEMVIFSRFWSAVPSTTFHSSYLPLAGRQFWACWIDTMPFYLASFCINRHFMFIISGGIIPIKENTLPFRVSFQFTFIYREVSRPRHVFSSFPIK